jgi:hypothetical protein
MGNVDQSVDVWGLEVEGGTAETEMIGFLVTLAAIAIVVIVGWWQWRRMPPA